jgi:surfactin synthase thioesterase subunit
MIINDWFVATDAADRAPALVVCFPHAGGGTRTFLAWQEALAGDARILAVCRPGREHRSREPHPHVEELIEGAAAAVRALAATDPRPIYLFGHSLGALVAFEVAHRLAGSGGWAGPGGPDVPHPPRHLVVSGCSAPSLLPSARVRAIAGLEGRAFAEAVGFFGGLAPEVIADDDLLELLLPGLIADFRMAVGYRYRRRPPLPVELTLINGTGDPHVTPAAIEAWRDEVAGAPGYRWAEGGHFYFERDPTPVVDLLRTLVAADQHVELI